MSKAKLNGTDKRKVVIQFLEFLDFPESKITEQAIARFDHYTYKEVVRPMVIFEYNDLERTCQQIAIKYKLTHAQIRWIVHNY